MTCSDKSIIARSFTNVKKIISSSQLVIGSILLFSYTSSKVISMKQNNSVNSLTKKLQPIMSESASLTFGKSKFRKRDFFISVGVFIVMFAITCATVILLAKSSIYASLTKEQFVVQHVCFTVILIILDIAVALLVLLLLHLKDTNKKLEQIACVDQLTGLCTKQTALLSLDHELCQAARHRSHVGICFIDMDNFKNVNDRYGHLEGDKLLHRIAKGMKSCVRGEDIVARFGDDEFLIILCDMSKHDDYQVVVKRLDSILKSEIDLGGGQVVKTDASLGISVYPEDGANIDELIRFADKAMYDKKREKKSGRATK